MYYIETIEEDNNSSFIECTDCDGTGFIPDPMHIESHDGIAPCETCAGYGTIDLRG